MTIKLRIAGRVDLAGIAVSVVRDCPRAVFECRRIGKSLGAQAIDHPVIHAERPRNEDGQLDVAVARPGALGGLDLGPGQTARIPRDLTRNRGKSGYFRVESLKGSEPGRINQSSAVMTIVAPQKL